MELADILSEESVIFCTDATTKSELLKTMAARAAELTNKDAAVILGAIESREALVSGLNDYSGAVKLILIGQRSRAAVPPPPIICTNSTRPNRIPTQISRLLAQGLAGFLSLSSIRSSRARALPVDAPKIGDPTLITMLPPKGAGLASQRRGRAGSNRHAGPPPHLTPRKVAVRPASSSATRLSSSRPRSGSSITITWPKLSIATFSGLRSR